MQRLHLVGFTTEHDGLVFSARKGSKAGGYIIPLDKELLSTIAEAERLRNGDKAEGGDATPRVRPASRLTPREIQAHLRAGRSIPEVAAEAGVDAEWVERFAVPVVAEQAQMVERSRAMTYSKARLGQSTQPLGTSVRWNLADKGVAIGEEEFEQGWSAFQLQDEVWMIRFRYTSRARLQVAEWELDLGTNQLASRNRLASELGYVEKGRRPPVLPAPSPRVAAAAPVRVVEEVIEAPEPDAEPEERPAPVRQAPKRRRPARHAGRSTAGKSSTTSRTRAKKASKKKTSTKKPTPAKKRTAKKATAKKATAKKAKKTTTRATAKRVTKKKAATRPTKATRPTPVKRPRRAPAKAAERPTSVARATRRPRKAAPATRQESRPPRRRPIVPESELEDFDLPPEPDETLDIEPEPAPRASRRSEAERPRIAASSAKEAAKRTAPPPPARPARKAIKPAPAPSPALSGPLARSLLARRLMARKSAGGNGGKQSQRPLRVSK